jgi:hypothetical protein
MIIPAILRGHKMRLIAYALSAACGCGTLAYPYVQSYYQPSYQPSPYFSASQWGGESVWGVMDSGPQYYVRDVPYTYYENPYYAQPRPRVHLELDAANHHHKVLVAHHKPSAYAKAKSAVHKTVAKAKHYIQQAVLVGPY